MTVGPEPLLPLAELTMHRFGLALAVQPLMPVERELPPILAVLADLGLRRPCHSLRVRVVSVLQRPHGFVQTAQRLAGLWLQLRHRWQRPWPGPLQTAIELPQIE